MINIFQLLGSQRLWLGTEESLDTFMAAFAHSTLETTLRHAESERNAWLARRQAVITARAAQMANVKAALNGVGVDLKVFDGDDEDEDDEAEKNYFSSAPLTRAGTDGSVGIIQMHGALVNSDAWYVKYLGQVGYPHLQDSVMRAVNNPNIKSILLDVDSPGGAVGGVSDTAQLLRAANGVKPVNTFAGGSIMSGAYWLGSQGEHITGGNITGSGSIGVLMVHTEYSQMLKNAGITSTVLRKGEYKALAQPTEPLSDKAKMELSHAMDVIYDAFTNDVAQGRGVSQDTVKSKMAEGKVFWGAEGLQAGLLDQIGNISDAVAKSEQLAQNRAKAASGAFSLV